MISTILLFLRAVPVRAWLYAGGIAAIITAYGIGHHNGYSSADEACKAAAAIEKSRQAEIARQSMDDAQERIDRLSSLKDRLELQLKVNSDEAAIDPAARSCGLSASGVQRIKRIGGNSPK